MNFSEWLHSCCKFINWAADTLKIPLWNGSFSGWYLVCECMTLVLCTHKFWALVCRSPMRCFGGRVSELEREGHGFAAFTSTAEYLWSVVGSHPFCYTCILTFQNKDWDLGTRFCVNCEEVQNKLVGKSWELQPWPICLALSKPLLSAKQQS